MKAVKQIEIKKGMKVSELVKEMEECGVMGAGRLGKAAAVFKKMVNDKECKIFFGLAGAMVPGGMKNIIIHMLKHHYIDIFVTTGANLTHDLVEALGYKHYQGLKHYNDSELRNRGINRIYDSFMPDKVYEALEDFFVKNFDKLNKDTNIKEFLWNLGSLIKTKDSILRICYEEKIPIFCPAIADSGIGLMVWGRLAEGKKIRVDAFDDLKEIMELSWNAKKRGVFYVGGGVPKNFIQQAMQLTEGAVYGIQITMDRAEPGGSSGASLMEGISWGKLDKRAEYVDVICDATIALPIIIASFE